MSDIITIEKPDMTALASEYEPLVEQANELVVDSIGSHGLALEGYKTLKQAIKKIKAHYEPTRKALDTAKKEILLARDKMITPFETAMGIVNGKVDVYEQEQQRIAKEQADREAEEERKRQEEQRIADAEAAEKAGDDKLAEEIIERPIEAPAVAVDMSATVAKVMGVSKHVKWHAVVVDPDVFFNHALTSPDRKLLLLANEVELNARARAEKDKLNIPGVRAVSETVRSVR